MKTCRLCRSSADFVNAHSIPEAFFRAVGDGSDAPLIVSPLPGHFRKKSRIGPYDEAMLCGQCEKAFDVIDNYGIDVLLKSLEASSKPIEFDGVTRGFQVENVDHARLLRFLVAVLWRASHSSQLFYRHVTLGPFEARARTMLLDNQPDVPSEFSAVLSRRILDRTTFPTVPWILDPFKERWDGINGYRVYLGEVVAYIKVDRRPFHEVFRGLALGSRSEVVLIAQHGIGVQELDALVRTAQLSMQNQAAVRRRKST